jgi:hypothetical protein
LLTRSNEAELEFSPGTHIALQGKAGQGAFLQVSRGYGLLELPLLDRCQLKLVRDGLERELFFK